MPSKILGKPESHSDVINREPRTLLLGYGWVGQHVHRYFKNADYFTLDTGLCDKNNNKLIVNKPRRSGKVWDLAFISVPSPMLPDGSCDTSIVESCVKKWRKFVDLFIIRSTVTPGTTDYLAKRYKVRIVMQPEYIGETLAHPMLEPSREIFVILGGRPEDTALAAYYWQLVLHPNSRIREVSGKTAEVCKYMENSFLGIKVSFVNEFAAVARKMGIDFNILREAWLDDPRIGRSHTFAYPHNPGFSGKCLPKDINSIVHYSRNVVGRPMKLMESVLKINAEVRKEIATSVPLLPSKKEVRKWRL